MSLELYLAYVLACCVVVIVPGPTVTLIVANALRHGARAGLLNVAGTQLGLVIMLAVLAAGLHVVVENLGHVFEWVRFVGAAYLVWLGIKLWRSDGTLGAARRVGAGGSFLWQGFVVVLANPKALLFFGAFIPQFIDPAGEPLQQTILLGLTFMAVATILDGAYAVVSGGAGRLLARRNVRRIEVGAGSLLIGGGLWLALRRG